MADKKRIIRLDNVAATKVPSLIKSAKYFKDDAPTAVENGVLVTVGKLIDGEREVHKVTDAESGDKYVGIVATPELEYSEIGYHGLDTFENEADAVIRVIVLQKGDIFSIANEGDGADKEIGDNTAEFVGTETVGRFVYNVYEVK